MRSSVVLLLALLIVSAVALSASADNDFDKVKFFLSRRHSGKRCSYCVCPSGYPVSGCCCHGSGSHGGHCQSCVCPSGYGTCCC